MKTDMIRLTCKSHLSSQLPLSPARQQSCRGGRVLVDGQAGPRVRACLGPFAASEVSSLGGHRSVSVRSHRRGARYVCRGAWSHACDGRVWRQAAENWPGRNRGFGSRESPCARTSGLPSGSCDISADRITSVAAPDQSGPALTDYTHAKGTNSRLAITEPHTPRRIPILRRQRISFTAETRNPLCSPWPAVPAACFPASRSLGSGMLGLKSTGAPKSSRRDVGGRPHTGPRGPRKRTPRPAPTLSALSRWICRPPVWHQDTRKWPERAVRSTAASMAPEAVAVARRDADAPAVAHPLGMRGVQDAV